MGPLDYPAARRSDTVEDWHGVAVADPYDWFRDARDPELREWVRRENALTDEWFGAEAVAERARQLREGSLPAMPQRLRPWRGGYLASVPNDAGCCDHVVLDASFSRTGGLPCLAGLAPLEVFDVAPSPVDDALLAACGTWPGDARPSVVVVDEASGRPLFERAGTFSSQWGADGRLYVASTEGDVTALDSFEPSTGAVRRVLSVGGGLAIMGCVERSCDGRWVLFQACRDYSVATWHALDVLGGGDPVALCDAPVEWTYVGSCGGGHCFVDMTSCDSGRVVLVRPDGGVEVVMGERDDLVLMSGLGVRPGFVLDGVPYVIARHDVSRRLVRATDGEQVPLPSDMGDLAWLGDEPGRAFLGHCSFVDAPSVLGFDGSGLATLMCAEEAEWPDVVVEQRMAPSQVDGTPVPYYLVHRADAPRDGSSWALVYAYGGYNSDVAPSRTEPVTGIDVARWVQAGNVYVQANLRGGSEYGPRWHEAGMGAEKPRCYEDYLGVVERLVADGWTSAGRIAISGCSNGGLLNSVLLTRRPDLWGCVIDSVPHTDMLHFAFDDRGPMYVREYGDPLASRESLECLLSFSPYHNVRHESYPPTYVQTGECDDNVPPYHAKKLAARLQQEGAGPAPVLLRVLEHGSHNRGGTPEEHWSTLAEMRLFLERAMGRETPC